MWVTMWRGILLLVVLCCVAWVMPGAVYGKDVYRWRDASGVVHFADRPAAEALETAERIVLPVGTPSAGSGRTVDRGHRNCVGCGSGRPPKPCAPAGARRSALCGRR